jgi:hypothetical protein
MKNVVFWDVALCRSSVNRRFGGIYRLHLQGRKIYERRTSVARWLATSVNTRPTQRHIPEEDILHRSEMFLKKLTLHSAKVTFWKLMSAGNKICFGFDIIG